MRYDFDTIIERHGTNSIKYDFARERGKPEELLPLWVADMDFPAPPQVLEDIQKVVSHGIFGYTDVKDDYYEAIGGWFRERFDYSVTKDEVVKTPGMVFALAMTVRAYSEAGDSVMIQTPVYHPFYTVIHDNGRKLVKNPLIYKDGKYRIDFEDFQRKAEEQKVKLFLLCSPHNPVGRVWTLKELQTMNEICERCGIVIVSDEIHCDFVYDRHVHTMFGRLNENAVVATSPSKTFNLAGLQVSNLFIKNSGLRRKMEMEIQRSGYSQLNGPGLAACKSAYVHGGPWLKQLLVYLAGNISYVRDYLYTAIPEIRLVEPEGTYLLWLDFGELGLSQTGLEELITNKAKLWLSSGTSFGDDGKGFVRMNIACPRSTLKEALKRLECCFHMEA